MNDKNLAEEWKEHKVEFSKIPFAYIHFYQTIFPLIVLTIFNLIYVALINQFKIALIIQIILLPGNLIFNYFIYIFSLAQCSKWLNLYYEKKSPPQQGIFARDFADGKVSDPQIHYYHLRGFLYKWPVWVAKKSIFPWMLNYVLREVGGNKINKNFMYGDAYVGLELTNLQENAVVMEGCIVSSHIVDSLYGNLTVKEVRVENEGILLPNAVAAPGVTVKENVALGPNAFAPKGWCVQQNAEGHRYLWGVPPQKKGYNSFIDLVPEKMKIDWHQRKKKHSQK